MNDRPVFISEEHLVAHGKTKDIYVDPEHPHLYLVRSRDDITAGDGERREIMEGKAALSTTTTVNNFRFLKSQGIPVGFEGQFDPVTFRYFQLKMIPFELVIRRVAWGSFLKRENWVPKGTRFPYVVFEMFLKDDARHDPMMVYDEEYGIFRLYDPKQPLSDETSLGVYSLDDLEWLPERYRDNPDDLIDQLRQIAVESFIALEQGWTPLGLRPVDCKVECGIGGEDFVFLGDVVDADSWRAWWDGDPQKSYDKDKFRAGGTADESLEEYRVVAELSGQLPGLK